MRIGVVGGGYWGSKHVRVLSGLPGVARVVIIEPDPGRREQLTAAYPEAHAAPSLLDALPMVDAVVIATPARTHSPLARIALKEGKHVLVEKPMAASTAEAVEMSRMAEQQGLTLMVGHTFEHNEAVRALRTIIRRGDLGDIRYLSSARLNLGLYQSDVNVVWDLAPHDVSIMNYLLDSVPRSVDCWGWAHVRRDLEDVAYLNLVYDRDIQAQVQVSWLDPYKVRRLTAVGSDKMAVYDDLMSDGPIRLFDRGASDGSTESGQGVRYWDNAQWSPEVQGREALVVEDEHFLACIATGSAPSSGPASGLVVTATLEAAERSLRQRRRVDLDEVLAESGAAERNDYLAAKAH